jgi:pilus assembly protein Flp/PilA
MLKTRFWKFSRDERGATAIEYALIAGIVSLSIIIGLTGIKGSLQNQLNSVAPTLQAAK